MKMETLKDSHIKLLVHLNNSGRLERDMGLGGSDGTFLPTEVYGVIITKRLVKALHKLGLVKSLLVEKLQVPMQQFRLTQKGEQFIAQEISNEAV